MSTPVAPATSGRRGLWRWTVALLATVALVVSGSGLVVFAQSGGGESEGPVFVPAEAPIYLEARLDMPEGQGKALAQMMTAFPGFNDPGTFEMKMDELINGATGAALPEGDVIGDALTGEIGIAVTSLDAAMANEDPTMLMGMPIANPEMAEAMAESLASGSGMEGEISTEVLGDTTVVSDVSSSAAIHGDWMLFSNDPEMVKAAVDVLDGNAPSLADDPDFAAAWSRLPSARLGAAYVDMQSFGPIIDAATTAAVYETGMELPLGDLGAMLPKDMVMFVAAEEDRLNVEAIATPGETTPTPYVGDSELATRFPAETQLYIEGRELGANIETALTGLGEMMAEMQASMPADDPNAASLAQISMLLSDEGPAKSMLRGVPPAQFFDFLGDTSIGVGLSSAGLWLGIAGEVANEDDASDRLTTVTQLITLAAGDPEETGITVKTEPVDGVEVTSIMLPIDEMAGQSGLDIGVGDSISMAVDDGYLLIGLGDFVQSAISTDGGDSLATSAGYVDALGGDTVNSGVMYVNIASLHDALDPMLSTMGSPEWMQIEPYVAGLDSLIAVSSVGDEPLSVRMTLIAGQ